MKNECLAGKRFGKLIVVKFSHINKSHKKMWLCKCDCGNETFVATGDLNSGHTKSCGCFERMKHGLHNTRLYKIWKNIKDRCCNPNSVCFNNYGGRGITVCDEWKDNFQAFYEWAVANGYEEHLTIDRIDVNGNYEPSNCRWITRKEQCNNKRNNRMISYNGKTQTIAQWGDEVGISRNVLLGRFNSGWNAEKAFSKPVRHRTKKK